MTADEIQTRIEALEAKRIELLAQLNATMGAIQDSQYWLSRVEMAAPAADVGPEGTKET